MLKIFVNTWGNYNRNGAEGGEWLTLPMEEKELDANLSRIAQKMGDNSPEWVIHDYEWDMGFYYPIGEYESISRLNDMARDLADMDEYDLEKLDAIIEEFSYDPTEALYRFDEYTYYSGKTLREVAEELVEECYDIPEIALLYFDYDAFARDLKFDGYKETKNGVLAC